MKGMLPTVAALVVTAGCGARTLLTSDDDGRGPSEDAASSTGDLGAPGDDSSQPDGTGLSLVPLLANSKGWVSGNAVDVVGPWYAYGDCWGFGGQYGEPPGPCEELGGFPVAKCSTITSPSPGPVFQASPSGEFCLTGEAAAVVPTPLGYANIYGIGMAIDFNNSGDQMALPYDATSYKIVGFQFDMAGVPAGGVRVELPTYETSSGGGGYANWGESVPADGKNIQILFKSVHAFQPTHVPFLPAQLMSIQFFVPSAATRTRVTNLCVSALQAIVQN